MNLTDAFQITPGEVVALVGGGGKSTTMFRLGKELAQAGRRVLLTTTTHLAANEVQLAPAHVIFSPPTQTPADLLATLQNAVAQHSQVLLVSSVEEAIHKAGGIDAALVDALAHTGLFDVIINEADGAKKLPFKAPANHEPVIPAGTSLVIPVVGLNILGQPLDNEHAHRAEIIARLSGAPAGEPITAAAIAGVVAHPQGGLKNIPAVARVIPLLNKADCVAPETAQAVACLLLQTDRIDRVAIGAVAQNPPIRRVENRVGAVILAAGQASRFGSAKQLAHWRGKPLLLHAVETALASQARPVVVVLGAHAAECKAVLQNQPVEIVENPAWAEGQSTSVKAGLDGLPANTGAVVFLLADQPLVSAEIINTVIERYRQTLAPLVWPEFEGKRGNPVLFDRRLFPEIRAVSGDTGAKPVLLAHQAEAIRVAVTDPGILLDIDTRQDLPAS